MRLHLVDGTYELFRAHYSPGPGRTDPSGADVKATVGIVSSLLRLLHDEDEAVTHVAVAFDNPIVSFRNRMFAGYKDGADTDPALLAQFDAVEVAVADLGVTVWSMDEYEADDALATAAVRFRDAFDEIRILTPDKDLAQVVADGVVQVDRGRGRLFDPQGVRARLGVPPQLVPDYLALVGDDADGIPGIAGFGAKTAATILNHYGSIEAIPASATDWDLPVRGAQRLAERLREQRADALLYRELATLVTSVPLTEHAEGLEFHGVPRERFLAWCERVAATALRDRPKRWA